MTDTQELTDPAQSAEPPASWVPDGQDAFYAALTERNRGLIPAEVQRALASARVLVAGCGSTGGAAVEPLVRLGVQAFVLAEPGEYELNNLNRQHAVVADLGRNKAAVAADRVRAVNPYAVAEVAAEGVVPGNAAALLEGVAVVIDGVDVTTRAGWRAKHLLHAEAAARGVPVVSGYDMSGTQYVRCYRYTPGAEPLDGEVTAEQVEQEAIWDLLLRIVPREHVPADLIADIRAHRAEPEYSVPQLVYTSLLFGVLAARLTVEALSGSELPRSLVLDVHALAAASPATKDQYPEESS